MERNLSPFILARPERLGFGAPLLANTSAFVRAVSRIVLIDLGVQQTLGSNRTHNSAKLSCIDEERNNVAYSMVLHTSMTDFHLITSPVDVMGQTKMQLLCRPYTATKYSS